MSAIPPVLLVGAGRMGGALFAGWSSGGLAPSVLVDPSGPARQARPEDVSCASIAQVPADFRPAAAILAIKPQMAGLVLPALGAVLPAAAVVVSILAGVTVQRLSELLASPNAVVRAMPNTPASIGQGMTVAFAGPDVAPAQRSLADRLLGAVGEVAWVDDEALIDPATSVSGCGPAYVFLLAEILEQAGAELGLPPALARQLARKTVAGAAALLASGDEDGAELRRAVTSPNGVTERALAVLMDQAAWPGSIRAALHAAVLRAGELAAQS
jgi:pyrroline-5-carboxylate reductase